MLLDCEIINSVINRIDESKQIPNYLNYLVLPNEGLIWSKKTSRFIGSKLSNGYYQTALTDDNGRQTCGCLHRFIYTACYGPIPSGMDVNHIDENKSNNRIDNLNLLTRKENLNFGTRNERAGKAIAKAKTNGVGSKPVGGYVNGELKFTYPSTQEASRNGFNSGHICDCCQGKRKSHKGYEWRYI